MKSKTILFSFAIPLTLWALACTDASDLGVPCELIKKGADGNTVKITEAEAQRALDDLLTSGKQGSTETRALVSLGVAECEDLACVRDSKFNPGSVASDSPAKGYCSERCQAVGNSCKAGNSKTKYVCRSLMEACDSNPSLEICSGISSPLFCVQDN
ncbi:MAG: hypothetical protein FWG75_07745 [Cystobacterineae bacterium]|nr:hypothetical protein [Cystobacterineae bacterium]